MVLENKFWKWFIGCSFWCRVFFYNCHRVKSSLLSLELSFHLEVYYKLDRLLSDVSILRDNSKLRVSIIKKYSMYFLNVAADYFGL